MEYKSKRKQRETIVLAIMACVVLILPVCVNAKTTKDHSKERYYQLKSMEISSAEGGEWNFHPGLYYVLNHKDYSGGSGFFRIKFKESKSNVKSVGPRRIIETGWEKVSMDHIQNEIDSIRPLEIEETARTAERMLDLTYDMYKPIFEKLKSNIMTMLYSDMVTVDQEMNAKAQPMREELDLIDEQIKYIHKTGPEYQLEQAKRDLAYSQIKDRLSELSSRSINLYLYAKSIYNLYH